jgi:flagellar basal body-associated protein FliL
MDQITEKSVSNMDYSNASRRRRFRIPIFILIALVVFVLAAVVPMAVLLPKKGKEHKRSVILPLYIYPHDNSTWQPLYDACVNSDYLKASTSLT